MNQALKQYLLARAREATTWQAIVGIATLVGYHAAPDQAEAIISAGVLIGGIVSAAMPNQIGGSQ